MTCPPKIGAISSIQRKLARAPACTWWNSKSMNLQLSLEKKIINFKWFLMIFDYFENSWNDHEFLKNSFIIFMHILLAFWADMSFLENASKKFKFTNFDFLQNREFLSKFNNFFFQWKLRVHTFQILSCAHARAHARAKTTFSENSLILKFSVNFQHSK